MLKMAEVNNARRIPALCFISLLSVQPCRFTAQHRHLPMQSYHDSKFRWVIYGNQALRSFGISASISITGMPNDFSAFRSCSRSLCLRRSKYGAPGLYASFRERYFALANCLPEYGQSKQCDFSFPVPRFIAPGAPNSDLWSCG